MCIIDSEDKGVRTVEEILKLWWFKYCLIGILTGTVTAIVAIVASEYVRMWKRLKRKRGRKYEALQYPFGSGVDKRTR